MNAIVNLFENHSNEERNVQNLEFLRRFSRLTVSDVVDFSKLQPIIQTQPSIEEKEELKPEYILEIMNSRNFLPIQFRIKVTPKDMLKKSSEIMSISKMNQLTPDQFREFAKKLKWIVLEENIKRR